MIRESCSARARVQPSRLEPSGMTALGKPSPRKPHRVRDRAVAIGGGEDLTGGASSHSLAPLQILSPRLASRTPPSQFRNSPELRRDTSVTRWLIALPT